MTVTLELKPSIEAAAKAEAQARGVAVENYLQAFLEQTLPVPPQQDLEAIRQQRMAILERLNGKYAGLPGGSEEFAARKEEEKAREERFWRDKP
jgi:hypothetical protein